MDTCEKPLQTLDVRFPFARHQGFPMLFPGIVPATGHVGGVAGHVFHCEQLEPGPPEERSFSPGGTKR